MGSESSLNTLGFEFLKAVTMKTAQGQ
jgi:hypothetical protein